MAKNNNVSVKFNADTTSFSSQITKMMDVKVDGLFGKNTLAAAKLYKR